MTNQFATELMTLVNQLSKVIVRAMVTGHRLQDENNVRSSHYTEIRRNVDYSKLSAKDRTRLDDMLNEIRMVDKKRSRLMSLITRSERIIYVIYNYIDQEDPQCLLPSHTARLIKTDFPDIHRVSLAEKKAIKQGYDKKDSEFLKNLHSELKNIYWIISEGDAGCGV